MSYGSNLTSDITGYIQDIFEGALLVARERNLMAALVTTFNDRTGIAPRTNNQYGGATIADVGESDDMISQKFTPSEIAELNPTEKGGQYFLTDLRLETDPFTLRADAALDLGQALATKMEVDIIGNFTSLTGGTIGAAGTIATWSYFWAMRSRLKVQLAPQPFYCVMHDYTWHALSKAASVAGASVVNAPQFQDELTRNFYAGTVGGVEIYTTSNVPVITGDDAYMAMFSPQAMALDIRRAPRLEYERDASRRGWELNLTAVYATGVWRPTFGIQGIFDAAVPTS